MTSSEMELHEQLKDVGDKLLHPPSAVDELLSLLDRLECNLIKVSQTPSTLIKEALLHSGSALISDELLRHSDADVKVSVTSCLTEIVRVTAPDPPYDDEQMQEVFKLTVAAFGKLSQVSSRCYRKVVSVLETVAQVRSFLLMLDLECDALVVEMFEYFLIAIRSNHSPDVFKYMEFIMTMTLQESEDISSELLSPLLDSLRKENQNVSPMSWELGEKVIKNCAAKLKPYLIKEVQSMGIVLKDYAQVVTSICENEFHTAEQSHVHGPEEHVAEGELLERTCVNKQSQVAVESVCAAEVGSVVDGSKSILTVDIAETRNGDTMKAVKSVAVESVCAAEVGSVVDGSKSILTVDIAETRNDDTMKAVKSVAVESVCAAEVGSVVDGSKSILTVDIAETRNDDTMKVAVESVCAAEVGLVVDGSKSILTVDIAETRNDDTMKAVKSGNDPETVPKKRCRRPNSLMTADEGYDRSWITSRRKNPKAFETPHIIGEQLVGTRIRVWWPKDKMFYEGAVDSFDHIKKKHKILYDDGEVEILNLTTQRWELIQDSQMPVERKQADIQSHDALLKCGKRKRKSQSVPSSKHERKSQSVPSSKHEKADSRIEASTGKPTDGSTSDNNII